MLLRAYRDRHGERDPRDADGWFATGDAGALDAHGQLVVHGRRGGVIVTGGEKVWPETVERVLGEHPDVAEVLVCATPDPEWGALVTARVVPHDPAAPPSLEDLRAFARDLLPRYALPRAIEQVAALERTALGKLRRG
jgi:O-succinylbenzoic acid--CoA ligase